MPFDYSQLVDNLKSGNLVGFVGAGVSRKYEDPISGRKWPGFPTATDLVKILSKMRPYIEQNMNFPDACFLYKKKEGRSELESFILSHLDRPTMNPLPAHVLLANLPFSAFITTNFDLLLEKALINEKKKPLSIINDEDVCKLRPYLIPLIKMHGCVSRPSTMVSSSDEYIPLHRSSPIIEALLKTQLANKVVLFMGFGLNDQDFAYAFDEVKNVLEDHMPRSYAIVHSADKFKIEFWTSKGVNIIQDDLTEFLRGLLRATASSTHSTVYYPSEDWCNNAFFESLLKIRTLPSETQVINAFLGHLLQEMQSPGFMLEDVLSRASNAAHILLEQRKNYVAFANVSDRIINELRSNCSDKEMAEGIVNDIIANRNRITHGIEKKGKDYIHRADNILVFSQSIRVLELLKGVPRGVQDTCQLYVSECRPKSPLPFQDAVSICENIAGTGYEITLIPDVAIGNLLARKQISKIVMGAHAIFFDNLQPYAFVNTCGSNMIIKMASEYDVPVYIVAEKEKYQLSKATDDQAVSYEQEEFLFETISMQISDMKAHGIKINSLNIGYDYCQFEPNVQLINESE